MRARVAITVFALLLAPWTAKGEEESLLTCEVTVTSGTPNPLLDALDNLAIARGDPKSPKPIYILALSPDEQTAKLVSSSVLETGELTVQENQYVVHFPASESRWEELVEINRYTGSMTLERGTPPFGKGSINNIYQRGTCKKGRKEPLF